MPPLAEQKRIVAKLEEILPLIDRYEAAWNKLEEFNKRFPGDMQKSILQMAIQGKLVEQRPEEGTGEELYQQIQAEKQALIKAGKMKHPTSGEEQTLYFCPCHGDVFELNGERVNPETTKSARSMDSLETRIEGGKVFVKFQNFQLGTAEKKPV